VIFVDSNIPMYLVGAPHAHKTDAQILVERCIAAGERIVTSAEVLQEILHRYVVRDRRDAIAPAFQALLGMVDEILPIDRQDVLRASEIVRKAVRLSARDALHLAVMERHGIERILSFDAGFDDWPGVTRIHSV
jgi:hypothetical protein